MGVVIWNGRIPSSYDVLGIPVILVVPADDDKRRLWRPLLLKADRRIRRLVLLLLLQIVPFPHTDHNPRPGPSDDGNALRICQDAIV